MNMVEIKADVKVVEIKIGDMIIEFEEDDFYEFIRRTLKLEKEASRQNRVVFKDINGNFGENFTIPTC